MGKLADFRELARKAKEKAKELHSENNRDGQFRKLDKGYGKKKESCQ